MADLEGLGNEHNDAPEFRPKPSVPARRLSEAGMNAMQGGPEPIPPGMDADDKPRSRTYTEEKLRYDYSLFTDKPSDGMTISEVQSELFGLLADGKLQDENQAFEWLLGRKWDEYDDRDRQVIRKYASEKGKREFSRIWKL